MRIAVMSGLHLERDEKIAHATASRGLTAAQGEHPRSGPDLRSLHAIDLAILAGDIWNECSFGGSELPLRVGSPFGQESAAPHLSGGGRPAGTAFWTGISRNVDQASRGTAEVATNIAGVANALVDQSRRLETEVGSFLKAMRSA